PKYSVITINNWDDYQVNDQQVSNNRPTSVQQLSTYKNEKNDKNEKNINNNNKGSSIRSIWENNGFGLMSSKTMTDFDYWISDFEKIGASQKDAEQLIVKAIEIAIDANARNYNYINAILKDWEQRGFKSVDEREAARKQKKTTKQQKSNTGHSDYDDLGF
ncbi:DnaD domain protein, partial [Enterococcus faecalis]|nr:DnaD domain protein [Enterococcus faecalis]EIA6407644.1 DnaD domain protein [Enterococcus faecalis]EIA6414992.1 DnaD domain protein [Enterococcus faecalis]EIA6916275.1 DnaD domain protein [Enterococcus faecalis]